jgi:hypothetical protein
MLTNVSKRRAPDKAAGASLNRSGVGERSAGRFSSLSSVVREEGEEGTVAPRAAGSEEQRSVVVECGWMEGDAAARATHRLVRN